MSTISALLEALTGDAPVEQVLTGAFWTAVVLATDPPRCGLASTLRDRGHPDGPPVSQAGDLLARTGRELAQGLVSTSYLEASIGMAAYNALLEVDEAACVERNAEALILERGAGQRVAIVGHFPFVDRVRQAVDQCWVIERDPRPGDLPAGQAAPVLAQADVVAVTGTTLINHTFDEVLAQCRPDAFIVVLGASAPLSPVLFEAGVDAVCGTQVSDPSRVLRWVAQGATFRQIKRSGGVKLLTMREDVHTISN